MLCINSKDSCQTSETTPRVGLQQDRTTSNPGNPPVFFRTSSYSPSVAYIMTNTAAFVCRGYSSADSKLLVDVVEHVGMWFYLQIRAHNETYSSSPGGHCCRQWGGSAEYICCAMALGRHLGKLGTSCRTEIASKRLWAGITLQVKTWRKCRCTNAECCCFQLHKRGFGDCFHRAFISGSSLVRSAIPLSHWVWDGPEQHCNS